MPKYNGKYLIINPAAKLILTLTDALLTTTSTFKKRNPPISKPIRKILLSNGAHLGDVLISTSILPILKSAYPDAKIGFIIGAWSKPILENHPLVDKIHIINHWKLNRDPQKNRIQKIQEFQKTGKQAFREVKGTCYDLAIDLYPFYPNNIPTLNQLQIPTRIGFTSGGYGPTLTHKIPWDFNTQSPMQTHLLNLLDTLNISQHYKDQKNTLIDLPSTTQADHITIHIGSGDPEKKWPKENWRKLAKSLSKHKLLFTGKGASETQEIQEIIKDLPHCTNLSDKQPWQEFLNTIKTSKALIAIDSLAGHIASTYDTPSLLLFSQKTDIHLWSPPNPNQKVLSPTKSLSPEDVSKSLNALIVPKPDDKSAHN